MTHHNNHDGLCKCQPNINVAQTLDEMEFERGIWSAAIYNDISRLKSLISKGHTDNRDNSGYTALHYAARNGHLEACRILINSGADVNATTNGGATPLHRAAMMGHIDIVNLLLSNKANTNMQDDDGKTVLHRAAVYGNEELLKILLKSNINLKTIKDKTGKTSYDLIANKFPNLKSILKTE